MDISHTQHIGDTALAQHPHIPMFGNKTRGYTLDVPQKLQAPAQNKCSTNIAPTQSELVTNTAQTLRNRAQSLRVRIIITAQTHTVSTQHLFLTMSSTLRLRMTAALLAVYTIPT